MTLGILDWGIGGCGFYSLLRKQSAVPVIYLSDSGYEPYGRVPESDLKNRVSTCLDFLIDKGATHITVACNSAGSVVEETEHTTSVLTHALEQINATSFTKVGIIGGKRTIESNRFMHNDHTILAIAQVLSAHIEAGNLSGEALENDVREILADMRDIEALFLACTHYPAIRAVLKKYLPESCQIIDPAQTMLDFVTKHWPLNQFNVQPDQWFTTGNINQTKLSAQLAFNVHIREISQIEL